MRFLQDPSWKEVHRSLEEVHRGWCLLGLLALPLLAGCGGGGGGSNGNSGGGSPGNTSGTNTSPITTPLTVSVTTATGLTATLSEPSSTVAVGSNVTYTLTLTNSTAAAIPIHTDSPTSTAPFVVLVVNSPAGPASFQPTPGGPPIDNGSLAPGQSLTTTQVATGFTTAGVYSATATFGNDVTPTKVGPLTVTAQ